HPGVPRAVDAHDEITGKYEGEELEERRARRPTPERILRLERKHDELAADVKEVRQDVKTVERHLCEVAERVAHVDGQMEILPKVVDEMRLATRAMQEREHVTFTAKLDLDKAKALGDQRVATQEKLDVIDARKARRRRVTKLIGAGVGLISATEV